MIALLPTLLAVAAHVTPIQEPGGTILTEPKTGTTITLPEDWSFSKVDGGFMALSKDERAFILLAAAEKNFDLVREDVRALILSRLDDVTVARSVAAGVNERGALEALIMARGKGVSKLDGEAVEFAGLVVKSGDAGSLALGAWKGPEHEQIVAEVMQTLRVLKAAGEGGLEMTDAATGASITFPEGWEVAASRKGIVANAPERGALVVILRWQADFDESADKLRALLATWLLSDVKLGEFAVVEASYHESLGRVVAATGTAVDRIDEKPVEFSALRIQNVDQDLGSAIFGVWKDAKHAKQVEHIVASIHVKKKADGDER